MYLFLIEFNNLPSIIHFTDIQDYTAHKHECKQLFNF